MSDLDWRREENPGEVLRALSAHRLLPVAPLLADRGLLRRDLVPAAEHLSARIRVEMQRRLEIEHEVLRAFADSGLRCLVHKGAVLGRTLYPEPWQRQRLDIDLVVAEADVETAAEVLRGLGFALRFEITGGPPSEQTQWVRRDDPVAHSVDLHTGLFNDPVLKETLTFEALLGRSRALPGVGGRVRAPGFGDLLLHACLHYFGHHRHEFRPDQWLLDMDLLWRAMDEPVRAQVARMAERLGVVSLLGGGLELASERFGTPVPADQRAAMRRCGSKEAAARLLEPVGSRVLDLIRSGLAERGLAARARYLWRVAFPPAQHMRRKYPRAGRWTLPWLYLRRAIARGARRGGRR